MDKFAIIITAYNRAEALSLLLSSLDELTTKRKDIDLIISLEHGSTQSVIDISNNYQWGYGGKKVVYHEHKLGLRDHFFWVGDQTKYYKNVLFLEDDLFVSPYIIEYAEQFCEYYKGDEQVAAISFYTPLLCEFNATRFYPIDDGSDVFFFQHPYWGNLWQEDKWNEFREWFKTYKRNDDLLPNYVRTWKNTSFKVVYIQYLIETKKYVVYPKTALVNNMGFAGLHNSGRRDNRSSYTFQVPLAMGLKKLNFNNLNNSMSIYDANFEVASDILKKLNPELREYDFEVDLKRTHDSYTHSYILSCGFSDKAILQYSNCMKPLELGVALGLHGDGIMLVRASDLSNKVSSKRIWFEDYKSNNMTGKRYLVRTIVSVFKELISRALGK